MSISPFKDRYPSPQQSSALAIQISPAFPGSPRSPHAMRMKQSPKLSNKSLSPMTRNARGSDIAHGQKIYVEGIKVSPTSKPKLDTNSITDLINHATGSQPIAKPGTLPKRPINLNEMIEKEFQEGTYSQMSGEVVNDDPDTERNSKLDPTDVANL